jgi:hypothetical protein
MLYWFKTEEKWHNIQTDKTEYMDYIWLSFANIS